MPLLAGRDGQIQDRCLRFSCLSAHKEKRKESPTVWLGKTESYLQKLNQIGALEGKYGNEKNFGRLSWNDAEIEGLAATPLTPPPLSTTPLPQTRFLLLLLLLFSPNPTARGEKKRNVNLTQRKV